MLRGGWAWQKLVSLLLARVSHQEPANTATLDASSVHVFTHVASSCRSLPFCLFLLYLFNVRLSRTSLVGRQRARSASSRKNDAKGWKRCVAAISFPSREHAFQSFSSITLKTNGPISSILMSLTRIARLFVWSLLGIPLLHRKTYLSKQNKFYFKHVFE